MSYKIIETHAVYEGGKLNSLAVLWQSNPDGGWVRATYFTSEPVLGYASLMPGDILNENLIQRVAGYGRNLPDELKAKYFPGKKKWER